LLKCGPDNKGELSTCWNHSKLLLASYRRYAATNTRYRQDILRLYGAFNKLGDSQCDESRLGGRGLQRINTYVPCEYIGRVFLTGLSQNEFLTHSAPKMPFDYVFL
jgi:hypothetical protein